MPSNAKDFRVLLTKSTGLSDSAISAAWPEWWSDAADASPSAQAELRFSLARKLGLDPTSLFDDGAPRFVWDDTAKYKNFTGDVARERPAITSFGISLGRILAATVPESHSLFGMQATDIRRSILASQPFIRLQNLLALLWGLGVPAIHLRVYPLNAKRMCAMAVMVRGRASILLAKDAQYPAPTIFHLAHEIGHIALGHIGDNQGIVDMEDTVENVDRKDAEEIEADRYALELLTGDPDFKVSKHGAGHSPRQLAEEVMKQGPYNGIEPGTLALCYGHVTREWATVQAAMPRIYMQPIPVWRVVNQVGDQQIQWGSLSDENSSFLRAVMGGVS